VGLIGGK